MGQTDEGPWELRDVATVADVAAIVEQFYEDMESDPVIGQIGGVFQVKLGIYPDPISYPRP
jgi:truncated hemoglobin YjbI